MNPPLPRVREVLALLRDLSPERARTLLGDVVATLDAAEVLALSAWLPPSTVRELPAKAGIATVMNEAPMPWERAEPPPPAPAPKGVGFETGRIIAEVLPASRRRRNASIAAAVGAVTIGVAWLLMFGGGARTEAPNLVPLPPAREYSAMPAPAVAAPPMTPKKSRTRTAARKPAPSATRTQPTEWASTFEHRH